MVPGQGGADGLDRNGVSMTSSRGALDGVSISARDYMAGSGVSNPDASNFVIGCPSTGDGVVVFTDAPGGGTEYRRLVEEKLPGHRASLEVFSNPNWLALFT